MIVERPWSGKPHIRTAHTWFWFMGSVIAAALCPLAANADTETVDGVEWTYQVKDGKAIVGETVEEYREEWGDTYLVSHPAIPANTAGAVTIPAALGGYPVKGINESAFEDCALVTAITIPNGVEKIGSFAFAWCDRLAKVTIPASVMEIEDDAFVWTKRLATITLDSRNKSFVYSGNMLLSAGKKRVLAVSRAATSISIPNGVTVLPYGFLGGCAKLKTVTIPASVEEAVDGWNDAFGLDTCTSLTTIKVDAKNPAVKVVNNLLISKDDPSSVEYIPAGLTTVTIPASVRFFDLDTAVKCSKLAVDAKNPYYKSSGGCILSKDGTTFVAAPPALKNVVVPIGVKTVATYAFLYSENATVTIPASVTQLGDDDNEYVVGAAVFCGDVKSIRFLGNPPLTLWKNPFVSLMADWDGEIRVSTYSVDAWRDYFSLNAPFLYGKVESGLPGEPVFKYVNRSDYNWGDAEDNEYEPDGGDGIVIIGGSNIKGAVTIPARIDGNTVTGIGRKAFKKNKNVTAVAIPDTVNRIGYNAFGSCTALKSVTIAGGESVDMGKFSFSGCSGLAKGGFAVVNGVLYHYTGKGGIVTIPSTVRIIDDEVFRNNKTVTAVNIPSSVREIRDEAFEYCSKLTRVTCAEGVKRLGNDVFWGCAALARFNIPASVSDDEETSWRWGGATRSSRKLKSLTIADMENMGWVADILAGGVKLNASVSVAFDPMGGTIDGLEDGNLLDEKGVAHVSVPYLDALWSVLPGGLYKPTRKGFTFQGWYTAKAKGTKISVNTTVSKTVTYYAQWKPNKYKVTVKAGTGGKVAKSGSYNCGSTVKFTATPNKGYVFVRWDDAEFSEYHEGDYEVLWTNHTKQRRAAPLSLKIPPGNLTLTAVFAKSGEDAAAPVVALSGNYISWNLEEEPDHEVDVWVTGSLSFAPLRVANLPPGVGLVLVEDSEEYGTHYLLKVTNPAKLKPGSWNLKLSATNRSGRKSNTVSLAIVGRNVTAAVGKAVEGLETDTTKPYVFQGGVKSSFKLADLGATAINGWKLTKVTGLPSGWTFKNGTISGVGTPGTYTLFFTFANGKKTVQASATFVVNPLPAEFTGTYYGSIVVSESRLPNDMTIGRISLTVSSAGKVSGSFEDIMFREKCTFTGTALSQKDDGYMAKVSGKMGKKAISFNAYLTRDRGATFDFNVGTRRYYSFNCYQVYGKGVYGADDPVIADLEGKSVVAGDVTFVFREGGSALVTGTFVNPSTNKKFASTISAQLVRNDSTGTIYMPLVIKYKDGSGHPACYELFDDQEGGGYALYWIDP